MCFHGNQHSWAIKHIFYKFIFQISISQIYLSSCNKFPHISKYRRHLLYLPLFLFSFLPILLYFTLSTATLTFFPLFLLLSLSFSVSLSHPLLIFSFLSFSPPLTLQAITQCLWSLFRVLGVHATKLKPVILNLSRLSMPEKTAPSGKKLGF